MGTEAETAGKVGAEAPADGQQGNEGQPPEQQDPQNTPQDGGGGDGERSIDHLPKWAQELIRDTRQEAAKYRTQLREKESELEKSGMDEQTRAIEEAKEEARQEALNQANERLKLAEARSVLAQNRIKNPNDRTLNLLNLDDVNVDEDGTVHGLDKAVEALKTDYPMLVENSQTNPDIGNKEPSQKQVSMNDVIRQAAGRK